MEKLIKKLSCVLLLGFTLHAQNDDFTKRGILNASSTISPGFMLSRPSTNIYLHGFAEYFISDKISFKGDGYFYVGEQQRVKTFRQNSSSFFGIAYHFLKNRNDLFIGFQPGFAVVQRNIDLKYYNNDFGLQVCPMSSLAIGYTRFVGKYFNFFAQVRYAKGSYMQDQNISLDDLRISAGLGFNIQTRKN